MKEQLMKWELGETAYTVVGDLASGKTPLVCLHGGPGFLGKGMAAIAGYANNHGYPAIYYDQIGCGHSSLHADKPQSFWQIDIFIKEFSALIQHLGIADNFALIGHSWGGLLAAEIAISQPKGLKALILSSPLGDTDTWIDEVKLLLDKMPKEVSSVILRHEEAGTTDTPEYMEAALKFYGVNVFRIPLPQEDAEMFEEAMADQNVYNAMWGPSELLCNGTLAHHVVTDRISAINVPTLVLSGKYDECTPKTALAYRDGIAGARYEEFSESSHLSYREEAAKYQRVLNEFLDATT